MLSLLLTFASRLAWAIGFFVLAGGTVASGTGSAERNK